MSTRINKIVVIAILSIFAIWFAVAAYAQVALSEGLTAVAKTWFGAKGATARMRWEYWFLVTLSVSAALAAIGVVLRRNWGRPLALLSYGASCVWALLITVVPESWRGVWFSIWMDRRAGALVALLAVGSFAWLCSRQATSEFRRPEATT